VSTLLKSFGAFDEPVLRQYTRQCYEGIAYIHSHAVMHRDIKGANILVAANGSLKIADFGASAQLRGTVTEQNDTASLRGTPFWMAPEVIRQERYGRSADCWSMGMTVIEMATANHREFPRSSCMDPFLAAMEMPNLRLPRLRVHFSPHDHTHL
jgi:serine/threonine protein kinase